MECKLLKMAVLPPFSHSFRSVNFEIFYLAFTYRLIGTQHKYLCWLLHHYRWDENWAKKNLMLDLKQLRVCSLLQVKLILIPCLLCKIWNNIVWLRISSWRVGAHSKDCWRILIVLFNAYENPSVALRLQFFETVTSVFLLHDIWAGKVKLLY